VIGGFKHFWAIYINVKDHVEKEQSDPELLQNGRELTTKVRNNLGLSLCTVP